MSDKISLDTLANSANSGPAYRRAAMSHSSKGMCAENNCRYWVYAVILFIIVALLLAVTRPRFVRKCCDESDRSKDCDRDNCDEFFRDINWAKLLVWSLVVTVVILLILYALKCCGCFDGCGVSACM